MSDPTEKMRREMIETGQPLRDLQNADKRWTTEEMSRDFTVQSFMAPFVFVTRRADGVRAHWSSPIARASTSTSCLTR